MGFAYGKSSVRRMVGVDSYIVKTAYMALSYSPYDMSVPWMGGLRTSSEQLNLYLDKASKCDGRILESFHQSGKALDLVPWFNGALNYAATKRFQDFARVMFASFTYLQEIGHIPQGLYLHWGGFWSARDNNKDGYIHYIEDKFGWDQPHWEIRTTPQQNTLKFKTP